MDLLRVLTRLSARLAELTKYLFHIAAGRMKAALRAVFGNISFSWSRPDWMPALAAHVRKSPRQYAGGALGAAAVIGLSWGGWLWYQHLPHPPEPERITF
jgi:alpha-2-macroglobulin